jgi:uncharacterized protein (UPF0332 family)
MEFDWYQYFVLAEAIAQRSEEEYLRSSISRAYYAAFNLSRTMLQEQDRVRIEKSRNIHQDVINTLQSSDDEAEKNTGNRLLRLRQYRNNADYTPQFNNLSKKAEESIVLARRIISGTQELERRRKSARG